ncbi:MAG: tyrosine-type recombinase/integrase [Sulfitobacter sp.]
MDPKTAPLPDTSSPDASLPGDPDPTLAARLTALFEAGTPAATQRAYARDLAYITAWKQLAFDAPLIWPEDETVALRFILDHSEDLTAVPDTHPARQVMQALVDAGLRRALTRPAPATLDRYVATWASLHRLRGHESPFALPRLATARRKSRAAATRDSGARAARHSGHPITREVLDTLIAALPRDLSGLRDAAMFSFAFASGGRRVSEITALRRGNLMTDRHASDGLIEIQLDQTKTTAPGATPRLMLKGSAARMMMQWLGTAEIERGPVFRVITATDRVLSRGLAPRSIREILKRRLAGAGYPHDYATPHGFRSGFMTEAGRRGVPLPQAMRLSLHSSVQQAMRYYDEGEVEQNEGLDI